MSQLKNNSVKVIPVFMVYIVMGFIDIVGVSTGYIKNDFGLEDKVAQFLPSMALIWFFLFSVPAGLLIERFGKKNLTNIGMLLTGLSMIVPFVHYSFATMLGAFVVLGIGNTIVQVAANPLLHDVVAKDKYSSYMSLSQFIKATSSLLGPVIAAFTAVRFGNWKLVFAVYAGISFLTTMWLFLTPITEAKLKQKPATFRSCFSLLGNRAILLLVIGIFMIVGAEVGMNSNIVRKITKNGNIEAVAGNGYQGYFGDGGPATKAMLKNPSAITFDSKGNLYISDMGNSRIRKVDTKGIISTFAGTGAFGWAQDGETVEIFLQNFP